MVNLNKKNYLISIKPNKMSQIIDNDIGFFECVIVDNRQYKPYKWLIVNVFVRKQEDASFREWNKRFESEFRFKN